MSADDVSVTVAAVLLAKAAPPLTSTDVEGRTVSRVIVATAGSALTLPAASRTQARTVCSPWVEGNVTTGDVVKVL